MSIDKHFLGYKSYVVMLSSIDFHSDFKTWIVPTHEIGTIGLSFEKMISAQTLCALLHEKNRNDFTWKAKNDHRVRCKLIHEGTSAFMLDMTGRLELFSSCARCLNEIQHSIEINLHMRLLEQKMVDAQESNLELIFDSDSLQDDENEIVTGYFLRKSIDLGLILREQIFFSVPDYPYCGGPLAVKKEGCGLSIVTSPDHEPPKNPFIKLLKKT
ncbi:MAG: DUF177 domain-containing protein [Myxococcales bacterium]|nr:DUF177 domain-containing protein [Myxococcales bacterium]USN50463.1 MAG: DUF177 domain-containing protein [Myxococcales bacterium]